MKLQLIEKRKAESYTGDSLTYELSTLNIDQKKFLLNEIFNLDGFDPVKIKVEYFENKELQVDSFYGKILTEDRLAKYIDINFIKVKANINNVKTSFTIDFKDNYIRIKSNYDNGVNANTLQKIIDEITKNL